MSDKGRLHEQGFNYALAAALRKCFPKWNKEGYISAERTGGGKRVDIAIAVRVPAAYQAMDEDGAHATLDAGAPIGYAVLQRSGYRFELWWREFTGACRRAAHAVAV